VSSAEEQATGYSYSGAVSADGRFVVFVSRADNLVAGDTNGTWDVFRRDRSTGETIRVSVSSREAQGNRSSGSGVDVSADGRYVVFGSRATNLVRRDTNGTADVFLRDVHLGVTRRVSVTSAEQQGDGPSREPAISDNGRRVAFSSLARLVRGDTRTEDVYVRNLARGTTQRVSRSTSGVPGNDASFSPAVSANGLSIAFASQATNLIARRDRNFDNPDIFVRNLVTRTTNRVSVDSDERQLLGCSSGGSWGPAVDADASRVVFTFIGSASCGGFVMLRDRAAGETTQIDLAADGSEANSWSWASDISADGELVAFVSYGSNLVPNDTNGDPDDPLTGRDVFVRDVGSMVTTRVSVADGGEQANASSGGGILSADGLFVVFDSAASNLVVSDTNGKNDVFIRGPLD
jgi:Tol biopolymer transport system component